MQVEASGRRATPGRQTSSQYLMSWVAVGAFGLGYIGVATTRPDLLGTILPLAEQPLDQASAGRQPGDLAEEMVVLRKWINDLQHELAATNSSLQEQAVHNSVVLQRIAANEERLGALREVREPTGKGPAPKVQTRAQARVQAPVPVQASAPAAEAGQRPAQAQVQTPTWAPEVAGASNPTVRIMNSASVPITTGSVPDTTMPGSPAAKSTPLQVSPRAIEIGTAESLDGLRAKWGEIASRSGDVLADAAPRYRLSADGRAAPFTLLAGPFETPADATRACKALRNKGVACRVGGAYTGNSF